MRRRGDLLPARPGRASRDISMSARDFVAQSRDFRRARVAGELNFELRENAERE
jgi:hypothetical protein